MLYLTLYSWLLLILYIDRSMKLGSAREEFGKQLNDAIKHLPQQEQLVILMNMYGKDWEEHRG